MLQTSSRSRAAAYFSRVDSLTSGLRGAGITLEEARGEVETARRMGILAHYRRDMERYLSWEEELGRKYEAGS